jgi:thioredoxin-dependent peroxiredoxin
MVKEQIPSELRGAMIGVGDPAPDFTGPTADGSPFTLSTLRGRPIVLYFYPKANSLGCTVEARGFTEHYPELAAAGVAVVGVSVDSTAAQKKFQERCSIPYPLIADSDRAIARRYGVVGFLGVAKRVTFLIDANGRVTDVIEALAPGPHVRRAVEQLSGKAPPTRGDPPPG